MNAYAEPSGPAVSPAYPVPRSPAVREAVGRALVEGTTLSLRVIAERIGMPRSTLSKLKTRRGWRRPLPERAAMSGRHGGGHPIAPAIVAEARALLEGTRLSFEAIAARTGVSATTLCRWRRRGRWERPGPEGGLRARPARYPRGRGRPYAADPVWMAQRLVTCSLQSQKAIARHVGVSQAQISAWTRARGWTRPEPDPGSKRFAAGMRTGELAETGDRRGRPYAPTTRREARALYQATLLSTTMIGGRLGVHPATIARWAKAESWTRPRGRPGRRQLRGYFAMLRRTGG